ncbi:MAG: mannose-6-phosphate isomerase, partial [Bacteroidota bacterium]
AEIQQTSDITYRIYDFDRKDAQGNTRELHVEQALDAIDYQHYPEYKTRYEKKADAPVELVSCPYFTTNRMHLTQPISRSYQALDSFIIYVCMDGAANLNVNHTTYHISKGQAWLMPASIEEVEIVPEGEIKMLESWVPGN